jgi:hypothetical protein
MIGTFKDEKRRFRLHYWKRLLRECKGNVSAMARASGANRTAIHKILVATGLRPFGGARNHKGKWGELS